MTITAKVICDSIANNIRLTTLELYYPRFIHSQFMTHRMFSRNASSSRAIPVSKIIKEVEDNPVMPIHWGKNKPGMQADEEIDNGWGKVHWDWACYYARQQAHALHTYGYHKQIVNRLLEPFSHIKVIVTATEWEGFFKLRLHHDSQPEIQELARVMFSSLEASTPQELEPVEWHLPYVTEYDRDYQGLQSYEEHQKLLLKVSVARCARVSYNNHDNSSPDIQKDIGLADKLIAAGHMSPTEHQATPMKWTKDNDYVYLAEADYSGPLQWEKGITHMDREDNLWSGNFKSWIQYRQLL